jgi:hypothetical protein
MIGRFGRRRGSTLRPKRPPSIAQGHLGLDYALAWVRFLPGFPREDSRGKFAAPSNGHVADGAIGTFPAPTASWSWCWSSSRRSRDQSRSSSVSPRYP